MGREVDADAAQAREGGGPDAVRRARVQALSRSRGACKTRWGPGSLYRVPCVVCAYGMQCMLCYHARFLLLAELALNHGLLSLDFSLDVDLSQPTGTLAAAAAGRSGDVHAGP